MVKIRLENAFPPMDEGFERSAENAFAQIRKEQNVKHKRKFSAVMAVALAVMLAGTALAAGYIGSLRQQLESINATGAVQAVQDVNMSVRQDGCTVTVQEMLVEGANAYVTLKIATPDDQPMLVAVWEDQDDMVQTNLTVLDDAMMLVGGGYGNTCTMQLETMMGDAMPDGPLNIEVALAKPLVEIVPVTDGLEWDALMQEETPAPEDKLMVADIDGYGMDSCALILPWQQDYGSGVTNWITSILDNMQQAGVVEEAVRITVPVELTDGTTNECMRTQVKQNRFEFDGYQVVVDRVLVGEVDSQIGFRIIPDREMQEMTMDNDDPLWRGYELFDGETGVQYHASSNGGTVTDENGKICYEVEMNISAMGAHSDTLRIVPFVFEPSEDGEWMTIDGPATIALCEDEAFVIELLP